jgi:GntR family transcriptional repressor for pyruvate dehydrogenase complex
MNTRGAHKKFQTKSLTMSAFFPYKGLTLNYLNHMPNLRCAKEEMFRPIPTDRISRVIVDQIKEAVFQKKLNPGDKLPSERQLMSQFKTSRVTMREALRTLEQFGILEIRRGNEGGAFIRDPNTKFVNNFLQDMFAMGKIMIPNLTEARMAVEPFSVKLAAERITEEGFSKVMQNIQEAKDYLDKENKNDARLLHLEFHRLIAQASQNPVIFFMIDSIMDIMEKNISSIPVSMNIVERTTQCHQEIYGALRNRDVRKAQDLMFKHIQEVNDALEGLSKKNLEPGLSTRNEKSSEGGMFRG